MIISLWEQDLFPRYDFRQFIYKFEISDKNNFIWFSSLFSPVYVLNIFRPNIILLIKIGRHWHAQSLSVMDVFYLILSFIHLMYVVDEEISF